MKAMLLHQIAHLSDNPNPLTLENIATPVPQADEILLKVAACGVCHTELDEIEGRTPPPQLPIVLGHQVIGHVAAAGNNATRFAAGERVGVAWIYRACGKCTFCRSDRENLCARFQATGRDAHGGYAQYMRVSENFAFKIPAIFTDSQAAPLLCAGAIGYRSMHLAKLKNTSSLGLTGFGASAHLVLKLVRYQYPAVPIFVFARSAQEREFAKELGAVWAGDTTERPPDTLDCIIDTTPAWTPVISALDHLKPGGRLVINAIRKEEKDKDVLLKLDYPAHLWLEKEIKSVANVARKDVSKFLELAAEIPIMPDVQEFAVEEANTALLELKQRKIRGAKVLVMSP
jgi:propanol-preferring alcohol dehydrogenase